MRLADSSTEQLADAMRHHTGQRPDHHRAVDADELQIPPHLQLDAFGRLGGVPALHGRGDVGPT